MAGRDFKQVDVDAVVADYRSGLNSRECGAKYGVCARTILRRLVAAGEPRRRRSPPLPTNKSTLPDAEIIALYQAGALLKELAADYGCTKQTISNHLRQAGIARRPGNRRRQLDPALAHRLRKHGCSLREIAERFGVTQQAVHASLKRHPASGG